MADENPPADALVCARETYWAGEHVVPLGTVMAQDDPRVRGAHVEPFTVAPAAGPAAGDLATKPPRARAPKSA